MIGASAWILERRVMILVGFALVSAAAALSLNSLRFQSSMEVWFLEDDPELLVHQEFMERFQRNEVALLGVLAEDIFTLEVLTRIHRLTQIAAKAPFVARVHSLATVESFLDAEGDFGLAPLMPEPPTRHAELRALRSRSLQSPLIRGHYVSPNSQAAAIVIELSPEADQDEESAEFVRELRALIADEGTPGIQLALAGGPPFQEAFRSTSLLDARRFGLAALLMTAAALVVIFRSLRLAALPLLVVALAALWTLGAMAATGFQLTILSVCLIGLVITVGVADSIHVLTAYRARLAGGDARAVALHRSLDEMLWPCFITTLTTALGMLSLHVSTLQPVREFGYMAALGVCAAFVLSISLVPALLSWLPELALQSTGTLRQGPLDRALETLGRSTPRRARWVLIVSTTLVLAAIGQLPGLEMGSNPLGYFQADAPIRRATETLDEALGGSASIEFLVEAPDGGLRAPETLRRLEVLEASLLGRPGISQLTSILTPLKELRRALEGGPEDSAELPQKAEMAAQLHLLLEASRDYPQLVQDDASVGRISARARYSDARGLVASLPALDAELLSLRAHGGPHVRPTGGVKLMANMETQLLRSQIRSFLLSFAVVTAIMFAVTRSVALGMMAMVPNLLPVLLGLSFMAAVGFPLDPGTVMIASIALGLVVDDSVHFIVRFKRQRSTGSTVNAAVRHTLQTTGRAIVLTSLVLLGGFAVLSLSSFNPNAHFGLISALVVLLALSADLVILPAMLRTLEARV